MSIGEQVKELRACANVSLYAREDKAMELLRQAADTIESLSAKLQAADMERPKANYSIGDLSELIDKFDNEKIKGITDFEQVQIFNALKYLDMYQRVGTISEFMELKQNMERSAADCGGGWISCSGRLPEEDGFYLVTLTEKVTDINDIRVTKVFFSEKSNSFTGYGKSVIAWQPLPEPYHEP